jgi:hypothetical protein
MGLFGYKIGGYTSVRKYLWQVSCVFNFADRGGTARVTMSAEPLVLDENKAFVRSDVVSGLLLAISLLAIVITVKAMARNFSIFWALRRRASQGAFLMSARGGARPSAILAWGDLPLSAKVRFFNFWYFTSILGDLALAASSVIFLAKVNSDQKNVAYERLAWVFLGLGTFSSYVGCLTFLTHLRHFNVLILSMRRALPRVARYILSVAPIFLGYNLLGVALFSRCSDRFTNMETTSFTLFSLLNGDEIRAAFESVSTCPYPPVFSQTFVYTFCMLFIAIVLNTLIFMVEDAYHLAKGLDEEGNVVEKPPGQWTLYDEWKEVIDSLDLNRKLDVDYGEDDEDHGADDGVSEVVEEGGAEDTVQRLQEKINDMAKDIKALSELLKRPVYVPPESSLFSSRVIATNG